MTASLEHLRSQIGRTSTEGLCTAVIHHTLFAQTEISQHGMSVLIKHHIIGFKISKNDIPLMQILNGQQDLSQIHACAILTEAFILMEGSAHIASACILKQHEQLLGCLEGVLETHNERVLGVGEHIALSFSVFDKVVAEDLFFIQDFHRVLLARGHLGAIGLYKVLFHQVDLTERALTELHNWQEVAGADRLLLEGLRVHCFEHVVILPDLNELLLPLFLFRANLLSSRFSPLLILLISALLLCLLLLQSLDKHLLACILLHQVLIYVIIRVHQSLDCVDAIVMPQHTVNGCAPIALATIEHISLGAGDQGVKELANLHVLSDIAWSVAEFVLKERICLGFFHQVNDAFSMSILTGIVKWGVFIKVTHIAVHAVSRWCL